MIILWCILLLGALTDALPLVDTQNTTATNSSVYPRHTSLRVVLLGDSVLDDQRWLEHPTHDVRDALQSRLRQSDPNSTVLNLAVDDSRVKSILDGIKPAWPFRLSRMWYGLEPYPAEEDGVVRPLHLLAGSHATHVILSVGGNDARVLLSAGSVDAIWHELEVRNFVPNFEIMLKSVLEKVPNTVLVFVYHPLVLDQQSSTLQRSLLSRFLPSEDILQGLLKKTATEVIKLAQKYRLPLIDLSRTFDPYNGDDYGTSPIEPSEKSEIYIIDLFMKVLDDFRFGADVARVYSGTGEQVQIADLDESFTYTKELDDFLTKCKKRAAARHVAPLPTSLTDVFSFLSSSNR